MGNYHKPGRKIRINKKPELKSSGFINYMGKVSFIFVSYFKSPLLKHLSLFFNVLATTLFLFPVSQTLPYLPVPKYSPKFLAYNA